VVKRCFFGLSEVFIHRNLSPTLSHEPPSMAADVNNTGAVVASHNSSTTISKQEIIAADPTLCVICLEPVSERAVALPCKHDCFDFPCLGNWLTKQTTCPLCKAQVEKLEYEFNGAGEPKIFYLPPAVPDEVSHSGPTHRSDQRRGSERPLRRPRTLQYDHNGLDEETELGLERRRYVYRNKLLSMHVGSNQLLGYQDLNPQRFREEEALVSRARKWIRRELQVFDFLRSTTGESGGERRRANNAEFLLEYIIAILKSMDLKSSNGHAEELLKDFIGRDNTRTFIHELQAWLRSPYQHLRD
jgi:Ring finger domain